ncbi:28S ribosomal protein S23, mitochondrial [Trichinella nativa]|uniref:Small ribosomal subunit protein mS23 n=3 Tax=Trichinella TaxID=6333 RepID=A0A0V1LM92_9BILA|nr:28S ribosomal protein S23, mitochondrial [Trichinella murrelli]KRZ60190.1 28S ribosomal protein S23, mitochondrial [Trichinella nativa]OUC45363.1 hypothetical protein D917_01917 [Trichinella nativa]
MAESRVEKVGSIFSRIRGLLKSGSMKPIDRPLWYDVYAAFPPKFDPHFDRPPVDAVQREIVYAEDFIRARFFKEFKNPGVFNLLSNRGMPASERFVKKFMESTKETDEPDQIERSFLHLLDEFKRPKSEA